GHPRSVAPSRPLDAMAGDERNRVAPGAGHPRSVAPSRPPAAIARDAGNRVAPGPGHPRRPRPPPRSPACPPGRPPTATSGRTRTRPLPDGRLAPLEGLLFGSVLTALGLLYTAAFVSGLALTVTLATAALYLFVYTPLKLRTPLCTLVGAVPGALPPVTGWVAAREDLGVGAWVLFGILFLWQLPHTLAIARLYRDDYARAGVRLLPVVAAEGS